MNSASMALPDVVDDAGARAKVKKAPNAFRTISEVADDLHIPQHVLRFWETKFPQVKPLKRGGGRRYYRPDDIILLRQIADLLYNQGYTIKGVQRLLREGGGKLAENIPPPRPEDKIEAPDEPQLPMPGLEPAPAAKPILKAVAKSKPEPEALPDNAARAEVKRLRAVLATTLKELQAIRALLG